MKRPSGDSAPRTGSGSVSASEVMTLREFGRRLGLGARACCDAQRQGLRTILFGRCKFVLGEDVVAWFRRLSQEQDGKEVAGTVHPRHESGDVAPQDRLLVPKTVKVLEDELEAAIAETIRRSGLIEPRLSPSHHTMEMMAKAATAVYEAVVENHKRVERD